MSWQENAQDARSGGGVGAWGRRGMEAGAILEAMAEAVVVCDREGRVIGINGEARELLGRNVVGEPLVAALGLTIQSKEYSDGAAFLERVLSGVKVQGVGGCIAGANETMVDVVLGGGPLRDGEARTVGGVMTLHDGRQEKEVEAAMRRGKEAAEATSEAKDVFLAALAHELRGPLTPVLSCCSAMEKRPDLPGDVREQLEIVCRNVRLAGRLTEDLLDVTRIGQGKLELELRAVDAHELVRYALEGCVRQGQEGKHEVRVELEAARHHVRGDPARLQQVFWNLIHNAMKFTPAGGRIVVKSSIGESDGATKRRSGEGEERHEGEDGVLVVEVEDSGVGIEAEVMGRLFARFEQGGRDTTRRYGGLGLGLAISKKLVELHGGRLSAESEGRGRGATFRVELPVCEGEAGAVEAGEEELRPACVGRGLRILLVEDHADSARAMSLLLRGSGHTVEVAGSRLAALELAERESFDLVLSDLALPDGSGLDLMRQLAREHHVKGVAVSGHGSPEDLARSRDAGFVAHVVKPVDFPSLEAAIGRAMM